MRRRQRGFTLIELLLVVALIGNIGSIVVPSFLSILREASIKRVISDLEAIGFEIETFEQWEERYPGSLDELDGGPYIDRWGNPYQYLPSTDKKWQGERRKDRFIVPLNSDFDLYSLGPDGESLPPLTARQSWDDIVRANDGLYVGPANEF